MPPNEYHFVTQWRVEATVEEFWDILDEPLDLPRWWPDVYLQLAEPEPGVFSILTEGWLPYRLRWSFRVTERRFPEGFSLEAWGDFDGRGVWSFRQTGGLADIIYDWRIRAEKPLLRYLSFLLKPVFAPNHRWAMARGEESLRREVARRHSWTTLLKPAVEMSGSRSRIRLWAEKGLGCLPGCASRYGPLMDPR
jgi:hypothetical protein